MTPLHIGADRTVIGASTLALGWENLARQHFGGARPSALELENAIAAVEDELARVRPAAGHAQLHTSDGLVREIAAAAGMAPASEATLTVAAVEQVFQRLAARAPDLPSGHGFAATLVLLRELMHHLQYRAIVVTA